MKEPKFKLGQEVWVTLYSLKGRKIVPKKDTVHAVSLTTSDTFEYELSNLRNIWHQEERLFPTEEEALKYAVAGNIVARMDRARWDIQNLNKDIRYLEEKLAKGPEELKKKRTALKRAKTKLAKLKKQLEDVKA